MTAIFALGLIAASLLGMHSGRVQERQKQADLKLTKGDPTIKVYRGGELTLLPGETVLIPMEDK